MLSSSEKKLVLLSTLFIILILNTPKLMSLDEEGFIARFINFNLYEYLFQVSYNTLFCLTTFFLNLKPYFLEKSGKRLILVSIFNLLIVFVATSIGIYFQSFFFNQTLPLHLFKFSYLIRLGFTSTLALIIVQIIKNQRASKVRDEENNRLKNLYTASQLQVLKNQLNPHFFFNALSSLSSIVQEDPVKARGYISHLSKVFRYVLQSATDLVPLCKELNALHSYNQLIHMRFEKSIYIKSDIPPSFMHWLIPHMSLQPLIENAVKHNVISPEKPLVISLYIRDEQLIIENNLQRLPNPEPASQTGLSNLSERFTLLTGQYLNIEQTDMYFKVYLPLKQAL